MATQPGPGGASSNLLRAVAPKPQKTKVVAAAAATKAKPVVAVKAKPLTVKQQAIQQVQAVNQSSMAQVNQTAAKTMKDAKAQAAQAAAQNPLFTPTWRAGPQGQTLAPGQGTRPDQTPVLAKPPPLVAAQPKAPKVVLKPKPPGGSNQGFRGLL